MKRSNWFSPIMGYINVFYYEPGKVCLKYEDIDYLVVDGYKFHCDSQAMTIQRVEGNRWFAKVRKTDVVVDIGANIGALTIPLASKALKVYAVEPLYADELRANMELNNIHNIEVWEAGLVSPKWLGLHSFEFDRRKGKIQGVTFQDILTRVGQIDFLKCDCEGYEWVIKPEELRGIRELRFELHIRRGRRVRDGRSMARLLGWLRGEYNYNLCENPLFLSPSFVRCYTLWATKRD